MNHHASGTPASETAHANRSPGFQPGIRPVVTGNDRPSDPVRRQSVGFAAVDSYQLCLSHTAACRTCESAEERAPTRRGDVMIGRVAPQAPPHTQRVRVSAARSSAGPGHAPNCASLHRSCPHLRGAILMFECLASGIWVRCFQHGVEHCVCIVRRDCDGSYTCNWSRAFRSSSSAVSSGSRPVMDARVPRSEFD